MPSVFPIVNVDALTYHVYFTNFILMSGRKQKRHNKARGSGNEQRNQSIVDDEYNDTVTVVSYSIL
jgi:hypothetical protein